MHKYLANVSPAPKSPIFSRNSQPWNAKLFEMTLSCLENTHSGTPFVKKGATHKCSEEIPNTLWDSSLKKRSFHYQTRTSLKNRLWTSEGLKFKRLLLGNLVLTNNKCLNYNPHVTELAGEMENYKTSQKNFLRLKKKRKIFCKSCLTPSPELSSSDFSSANILSWAFFSSSPSLEWHRINNNRFYYTKKWDNNLALQDLK